MIALRISKKLNHFDLEINLKIESKTLTLFGPSGSGKSFILKSIFNGKMKEHSHVQQTPVLFPHMSVIKNLVFCHPDRKLIIDKLEKLECLYLMNMLPIELSGGEAQLVAIIRATLHPTQVLCLDEPFSAMDKPLRIKIQKYIHTFVQETSCKLILVTHHLEEAFELTDHIAFIHKGKCLYDGNMEDFKDCQNPLVQRYLDYH